MKFIVSRTSSWYRENSPCEDAKRDKIVRVETRSLKNPEDFDERFSRVEGKWFSVGSNHRVNEHGYITRDREMMDVWSVEFNTLDELVEFCNKYGDVVIEDCMWNKAYKEIEIYDDYRE